MVNHGLIILLATIAVLLAGIFAWVSVRDAFTYQKGFNDAFTQCQALLAQDTYPFGSAFANLSINFSPVAS